MTKYMLITVCEQHIMTEQFTDFAAAKAKMLEDLEVEFVSSDIGEDDNGEMWEQIVSRPECYDYATDNGGFAFGDTWAWSTLDYNEKYAWKIVGITD